MQPKEFFGWLCKSQQDATFCLFLIRNLFFLWDKNLSHSQSLIKNTYFRNRNVANSASTFQPNEGTVYGYNSTSGDSSNKEAAKQRKIAALRQSIQELQAKIERADWDERIMKLRGTDISSRRVYMSQVNLRYQYERQLSELQYKLQQLESL